MASPRRKYIEAAYELLLRDGIEGFSSRKVATECGCSNAAIYKHFSDVDELIAVASVRFLQDYAEDARFLSQVDLNPLELNLQLWECLAYYSFMNAPIFENLFFGGGNQGDFESAAETYYTEFPEEIEDFKDFMVDMFSGGTMFERDSILLTRAEELGMLSHDSVWYLCKLDTYLFHGMLASIRETYSLSGVAHTMTQDFMNIVTINYRNMLEPGYSILVVDPDFDVGESSKGGILNWYQISKWKPRQPDRDLRSSA
jgi:AcrR family transcriptional regulator